MIQTNIQTAEGNLALLIEKAITGEEVIIETEAKLLVKLVPVETTKNNWVGMDNGNIRIADDFDELPEDLTEAFYGVSEK